MKVGQGSSLEKSVRAGEEDAESLRVACVPVNKLQLECSSLATRTAQAKVRHETLAARFRGREAATATRPGKSGVLVRAVRC